jgi:hypothetical protein
MSFIDSNMVLSNEEVDSILAKLLKFLILIIKCYNKQFIVLK